MAQVAVLAKLVAAEGKRDDLVKVLGELVDAVRSEPGTLAYVLHTAQDDPNAVWFYELYDNADSLAAHSGSEAMKAIGPKLAGLVAGRAEITRLEPRGGKGVPL
jgi:quinol monooxygenase YgiN